MADARVMACRAESGYRLWLRFECGLEGRVFLGDLLEIGAFKLWRDVRVFNSAHVDPETATVTWDGGVRLDPDILRRDIEARGAKRSAPADADPAFQRFMARVLVPAGKRSGRRGSRTPRRAPDA